MPLNTPSDRVEVHIAYRASKYQSRVVEIPAAFANEIRGV
jgi:hypothetical protein